MRLEQHLRAADHKAIALHLPEDTALVEFVRFDAFNFAAIPARGESHWRASRYLALVLPARAPDHLAMIDLGEADAIDNMVIDFRASIKQGGRVRGPGAAEYEGVAKGAAADGSDLRAAVFDPLIPHLDGTTRVLIAPDGELTCLPFEALPTDYGRRLIDTYHISYLSVGRDVLRFEQETLHEPTASVVIADPDFDLGSSSPTGNDGETPILEPSSGQEHPTTSMPPALHDASSADEPRPVTTMSVGRQSRDLARAIIRFNRLDKVEAEGREISTQLKVVPWLHEQALEGRLKATISPYILHIATHGFFLKNQRVAALARAQLGGFADLMLSRIATSGMENPLLRSGLVLAGVNTFLEGRKPPQEAEDGVLTAVDVSGLDLLATDLAVLSACGTGLGDVQMGEGVFGLRRAFMLAGVKTLVMSLWAVPDKATRELMVDFYRRIWTGEGRSDALRNAQLAIKAKLKYHDPKYWGAFICQGDPRPLVRSK